MAEKVSKSQQFALIMWSKKVKGKLSFSVQPLATVTNQNQIHNPRVESEIQERTSLSTITYQSHLGRVLQVGTKSACNRDAKKRIEKFHRTLLEEANGSGDEELVGSYEENSNISDQEEDVETRQVLFVSDAVDPKDDQDQETKINNLEKELKEKDITIKQLQNEKEAELKKKNEEITELIAKNIFLQNTLPSKLEEFAKAKDKTNNKKISEKMAEWDDPEVANSLAKLNFSKKEQRELKSKKKFSLLARACLAYCFPSEILARSVVKGGNQQKSKDDTKLDEDKIDDICEFIQSRFPDSDRKTIMNIFGLKIRDLKRIASSEDKESSPSDTDTSSTED